MAATPACVGIDLSTRAIDLVRLAEDGNAAEWTRIHLAGDTAFDRVRTIRYRMPTASFWDDVYLAAIERPFSQSRNDVVRLAEGAVMACVPTGVELWEVLPHEWKSAIGFKGTGKPEWSAFPSIPDGGQMWTQDARDAFGVALYARDLNAAGIAARLAGAA